MILAYDNYINMFAIVLILINWAYACRILALSGGGAHGAFQAGVIKHLHTVGTQWNVITGVSAGSLNGIGLGIYSPTNQSLAITLLENMWMNITTANVYKWNWNPIFDQSLLDSSPLNQTIYKLASTYGGVAQRDIIVGAVNFNNGEMQLFNRGDMTSPLRTTTIVMASSALPVAFPPVFLDGEYYVDGGTASNELIIPGIKYCLARGLNDIIVDVIICSPPIDNITNTRIGNFSIFGLGSRAYDILANAVFNHELYSSCKINANMNGMTIPMYLYKPDQPYPGNMLDFSHESIVTMFKMGLNVKSPKVMKYCFG
jgi:predicted patatin/cPLA2 family phospholipase